jgi:hypothetical protein
MATPDLEGYRLKSEIRGCHEVNGRYPVSRNLLEVLMLWTIKRTLLWIFAVCASAALFYIGLIVWPDPLFAFSVGDGKIIVKSDLPIPAAGGNQLLRDCEMLLARSPLKAEGRQYHIYVTNDAWRRRLFFLINMNAHGLTYPVGSVFLSGADFETGRLIHNGYVPPRPRTLAYYCGHELTHVVEAEHGFSWFHVPTWVFEGFPDYVGIENRQSFEELRDALGDRPADIPMMVRHGSYPRYRLLVTYFMEKKGGRWISYSNRD